MRLTDQQLRFFDVFGFLKFPGLFAKEIGAITDEFEQVWAQHGGGHAGREHDLKQRSALLPFIDQSEYLSSLMDDPGIESIASSLLGDDFNYTASDGNFYVDDTGWHSDGYRERKYLSVKMAFYLDPVTRDTGCLRVIPGSHHFGSRFGNALQEVVQRSTVQHTKELWGIEGRDVPAIALETEPGDLLMFNHLIKHASFGGDTRRRMFTINLEERHRHEDLELLRDGIAGLARFWCERAYGETMIRTASPSRMRHLEQRLANDDHLPELARKARQEASEPSRG